MPAFREDDDGGGFDVDYDGVGDDGVHGDSVKDELKRHTHRHMVGRTISIEGKRRQARNLEGSTQGARLRRTGSLAMMMIMMLTKMMTMVMKKIMMMIMTRMKDF